MVDISILARPSAVGLSHLNRLMLIARELMSRGVEVVFAFKAINEAVSLNEFRFLPVADVEVEDFNINVFNSYKREFIDSIVDDELKVISEVSPVFVMGDFSLTTAISSKIAGIPYISVVNGYMTDYFNPVDAMISSKRHPLKHRIASVLGSGIHFVKKRSLSMEFRKVARSRGINDLVSLYDFLRGDLTLIADLPEFCPLQKLPKDFRFIGPVIWEGGHSEDIDSLNQLKKSGRIIYVTTGNTGNETLIELALKAFGGKQSWQLVVTSGAYIDPGRFPKVENVVMKQFIPGSEVLKRCDVVIHCGGNGTTYQAMSHGVPAVVIPFNSDQKINAWLIKKNGVGIPLSPTGLSVDTLKQAVAKIIQDTAIKKNVKRFQALLSEVNGPKNAAKEIISFLENQESEH